MDEDKLESYWKSEAIEKLKQIRYKYIDIDPDDWNDVSQEIFISFSKEIEKGKYPAGTWGSLLWKIGFCRVMDYFRDKKIDQSTLHEEWIFDEIEAKNENSHSKDDTDNKFFSHKIMPRIRGILISKHRPLQDIMLVYTAKSTEKLREKVKEKFPFVVSRSLEKDINFEVRQISEKQFLEAEENEINDFYDFLAKTCKSLGMEDEIGIKAVKILLISQNPLFDWYSESQKAKEKDYLSFNNKGKLIRKKTIKRPYKNFFRDYFVLLGKLKTLKLFLKNEAENSKNPVSNDRINDWYQIGKIDRAIINKQKYGRVGRIGYKAKVKNYNEILKNLILELE